MPPQQLTQSRIQNSYHNMSNPAAAFQMMMQNGSQSQMNMSQYMASHPQQGRYGHGFAPPSVVPPPPSANETFIPPPPPPPPVEDERVELKSQFVRRRAATVSDAPKKKDYKVPSHLKLIRTKDTAKTKDVRDFLKECLLKEVLFQRMEDSMINGIADAMYRVDCPKGECIFRQNESGDTCFVLQSGSFDIIHQEMEAVPQKNVGKILPGKAFGISNLLYASAIPRTVTLKATDACVVWALDKIKFQEKRREQRKKMARLDKKQKFKINVEDQITSNIVNSVTETDQTSNIVSQLRVFGYNEIDIKQALNDVIDKNDINSIIEYIDHFCQNDSLAPAPAMDNDDEAKEVIMSGPTQQFYNFLKQHRLEQFFDKFKENECNDIRDIEYLMEDEEFLENNIGLKRPIHRRRFIGECKKLKEEMDAFKQSNLIPILLLDKLSECGIITMKILCKEVQKKLDLENKLNIADEQQCTLLWNVIQLQFQPQINKNDYAAAAMDCEGDRNNDDYGNVLDT
eukprot:703794_1